MQYLRIHNLESGMKLARPLIGDNGSLLANTGTTLSSNIVTRITAMGFQGAYIDTPLFSDIIVEDVISDDIRARAFEALREGNIRACVPLAKQLVKDLKYKEVLKLDLLDIKSDKNYVFKHSISVAVFAIVLGISCGLTETQLENLAVAGLLHDVGKLEIKKRVLKSKHIYNDKEMDEMKKHPMYAYEMLQSYPEISSVSRNSILFHHENVDGSGYYQIPGEKLGIFPRILRIVDTYDAMTAQKAYRNASAPAEAMEYIMSNVDKEFDRELVEVFVRKFPVYPIGFTVQLSNNEVAVIVSNDENSMRPHIRRIDGRDINLAADAQYRSVLIDGIL